MIRRTAAGLTFDWPTRERFPWPLFGFVFLSLVAHVASFFIFQVTYPQQVTIPPPGPQVALLAPDSPENEAVLRWIAAEDPALVAKAVSVVPRQLLDVPYRPSYRESRTAFRGSVETPVAVRFPPARDPLEIIRGAETVPATPPSAPKPHPTWLTFSPDVHARMPAIPEAWNWNARATEPLEAAEALLGIAAKGDVPFVFLQRSSGNRALDAEALGRLQRLTFTADEQPMVWVFATIHWGSDAYAALAAPAP
ncbi:MAG TPA: hypothetical protein VGO90_04190 [Chthoniobacteraceae bacterium]|jgi:hypothetical protein|nr:hypothetical protein [Chthoniobacter sp.]HEV7866855.1 hypothetical protein [Chthoniobacteraceae bacterium]